MTSIELDIQRSAGGDAAPWVKWLARFGRFCSGILWILVGVLAVSVALDLPYGRWIVGAIGIGVLAWGVGSAWRAVSRNVEDGLHTERMSETTKRWTTRAGVVGYAARAVVFALIGIFVIRAPGSTTPLRRWGSTARCRSSQVRRSARSARDRRRGPRRLRSLLSRQGRLPGGLKPACTWSSVRPWRPGVITYDAAP